MVAAAGCSGKGRIMAKTGTLSVAGMALLISGGCAEQPVNMSAGRNILASIQMAVDETSQELAQHVVYVKTTGGGRGRRRFRFRGRSFSPGGGGVTGIILSPEGHILIVNKLNQEKLERIQVWVNDKEYEGKFLKADDKLRMTVIKIEPENPLEPLAIQNGEEPRIGEWLISVTPTGKEMEFKKFTSIAFNRGDKLAGRYKEYVAGRIGSTGAPVVNIEGKVVGIVQGGRLLSMLDLQRDIEKLLAKATKGKDEE